jgi:SAM-dependent methyltransferase
VSRDSGFSDDDARRVIERYNRRLAALGPTPEALGWTKHRHTLRYAVLLEQWDLETDAILDVGCGFGDMYAYCAEHFPNVRYEGVDLNASLVEVGRERYPNARLAQGDPIRNGLTGAWDVIVASGIFNLKVKDNWAFITEALQLFARHARKGFAANFLSNRVDYELEDTYHADPVRVLELAYSISNRVTLRNDYMPFEFTVFVDTRRAFDPTYVVYPEYLSYVSGARPAEGPDGC